MKMESYETTAMKIFLDKLNTLAGAVQLDPGRKAEIRQQLLLAMAQTPQQDLRWYHVFNFQRLSWASALVVIIIVAVTTTSFAEAQALPGDLLYPRSEE